VKVMTVVGTRPEVIRLSRVTALLDESVEHVLVHTGQNWDYQLNGIFFDEMGIRPPDHALNVDTSSLGAVLGDTLRKTEEVLRLERPDAFLVLGDTNSSISALVARRMHVPVYHMEAGNRCFDHNVPEETNRRFVDHIADFNLVYTEHARRNLLAEGIHPRQIMLTGSPLREVLDFYRSEIDRSQVLTRLGLDVGKYFLVSAHREENVDSPTRLTSLVEGLAAVKEAWRLPILVSTHPRTKIRLEQLGSSVDLSGISFHEPFGFFDYNSLQMHARCVLSDSGSISEEASILGFPAITLRNSIERPEALEFGTIMLASFAPEVLLDAIREITRVSRSSTNSIPVEYEIADTSRRVVRFIGSTVPVADIWLGLRS